MATIGNDLDRAAARAGRQAAREARAALNEQISELVADVEALIGRLRDVADTELTALRARVEKSVGDTKHALAQRAEQAFVQSDRYVRSRPWEVVAIAASGALLIGVFIASQQRRLAEGPDEMSVPPAKRH